MTTKEKAFIRSVMSALKNSTFSAYRSALVNIALFSFKRKMPQAFSDKFVDRFLNLINSRLFLHHFRSSEFLVIMEYEWGRFTAKQKHKIIRVLESKFGLFADPTSNFIVSELLGSYWGNGEAFAFLTEHASRSINPFREIAICGLFCMMKHGRKKYRNKARNVLCEILVADLPT